MSDAQAMANRARLGLVSSLGDRTGGPSNAAAVPTRRAIELLLLMVAWAIGAAAYVLIGLNRGTGLPPHWLAGPLVWGLLVLAVHLVVRWRARYADPVILPCVVALSGVGLAMQYRLDLSTNLKPAASTQLLWLAVGMVGFTVVMFLLRDYRVLDRYTFVLAAMGLVLLLSPFLPVIGSGANGARIWISLFGHTFQPAEVAKVVLTLSFASYLADRSQALQAAGKRLGPWVLPRLRDVVPLLAMWAVSVLVLVFQNDFGTALLFFGLFLMMIYVATDQLGWVIAGLFGFAVAAFGVYHLTSHVRVRVDSWLHPFDNVAQNGQIIVGQFGIAWGGMFGRGWGLGSPSLTPVARSDFIASAISEELGLVGIVALILLYVLIAARGFKAAMMARDAFGKLLACGLSFGLILQVTVIVGGVTRLLPLTGLTTPFLSTGGSSLLAHWVIVALLIVVSHQARRPEVSFEPFIDLESEQTTAIDVSGLVDGGVGPRVPSFQAEPFASADAAFSQAEWGVS